MRRFDIPGVSKSRNIGIQVISRFRDFDISRDEIGVSRQIRIATRLSHGEGMRAVGDVFGSSRSDTRAKFLMLSAIFSVERSYRMTT